ncbi:CoA transferase subunit A [Shumkonia mesophila]|uniref:CoA transferase subunit A n=1 Tax=Shumkonia mesophila TaxID=2838854 RepID=UPI00293499CA|nr:CoA-transferase [Shumkonia mesophila]
MPEKKVKRMALAEAASMIRDGDRVAVAGSLIRRHPMALIHEMIRQRKRGLTLFGWNNGIDFDMLIGAGCVKEAHSAYVGLSNVGLAKNFRRAVEQREIRYVDHSETCAIDRFRAAATGAPYALSKTPLHTGLQENPEYQKEVTDPFTGETWIALEPFHADVAIMHAHRADPYGNVQLDPIRMMDNETDMLICKAANKVIVTVEEFVDEEEIIRTNQQTVLTKLFVDAVVLAPYGAHPNSCDLRYVFDIAHAREYQAKSATAVGFRVYLDEYVYGCKEWDEYLAKIGRKHLESITRMDIAGA